MAFKVLVLHTYGNYRTIRLIFTYINVLLLLLLICTTKNDQYNVVTITKFIHYSHTNPPVIDVGGHTNPLVIDVGGFLLALLSVNYLTAGVSSQCQIIAEGFSFTSNERLPPAQ